MEIGSEPLRVTANAQSTSGGSITITFQPCPSNRIWQGTISVPGVPINSVWTISVGEVNFNQPLGPGPWGPFQVYPGDKIVLNGSAVAPFQSYTALLAGINDPASNPTPYMGPTALTSPGNFGNQKLLGPYTNQIEELTLDTSINSPGSLWIIDVGIGGFPLVTGLTTGTRYPAYEINLNPSSGFNSLWVVPTLQAIDNVVEVVWSVTPTVPWWVIEDTLARFAVTQSFGSALLPALQDSAGRAIDVPVGANAWTKVTVANGGSPLAAPPAGMVNRIFQITASVITVPEIVQLVTPGAGPYSSAQCGTTNCPFPFPLNAYLDVNQELLVLDTNVSQNVTVGIAYRQMPAT